MMFTFRLSWVYTTRNAFTYELLLNLIKRLDKNELF